MVRLLSVGLALAVLAFVTISPVVAAEFTMEGKVVKAGDGKIVMKNSNGLKQHEHAVAADAAITLDGKACKLEDLKRDQSVKVTYQDDAQKTATKIEAFTNNK